MAVDGVVLFPGAGSDRNHSSLLLLEKALSPLPVARIDFPYRRAGKKAPDRAPILLQCVFDEVRSIASEWGTDTSHLVIGGRSMGGRICSMAVSDVEDPLVVAGLVLISYPLHPPGKPEKLRTEHLHRVKTPSVWISGSRDTFGSPDELSTAMELLAGPHSAHFIEGKGHDLKGSDGDIASIVTDWVNALSSSTNS